MSKKKKIVYATPDEIIYEPTKTILENTWDKLANHYQALNEPNTVEKMNSKVMLAKIELETNNTVYDLITKDVLKSEKINKQIKNVSYNLVKKAIQDCKQIVLNKLDSLRDASKKEEMLVELLKNYEYCIVDGVVNVYIDTNYLIFDEKFIFPTKWKPIGLCCMIKYGNIEFKGSLAPEKYVGDVEQVFEYIKEVKSVCEEKRKILEISVVRCDVDDSEGDEIAKFVIKSMKEGKRIDIIFEMVTCYSSRLLAKDLLGDCEIINGMGCNMIDGLSTEFFCYKEDNVLRVDRKEGKINFFYNECSVEVDKLGTDE